MSVHCFDKPVALMTCFWRESLHYSRLSFACNVSAHVNDAHLCVALKDDWIDEPTSFKMSQDFLRQVLINTFPSAHEADHHSTARFYKCDAWLSFPLCHCSNEHVIRLELRQCVRCLVHHNLSVRRTPRLATQIGHQSLNGTCVALCAILAASVGGSGVRKCSCSFRFTRNVKLSALIRIGDCSSITS